MAINSTGLEVRHLSLNLGSATPYLKYQIVFCGCYCCLTLFSLSTLICKIEIITAISLRAVVNIK